jgi:hypothetical protein
MHGASSNFVLNNVFAETRKVNNVVTVKAEMLRRTKFDADILNIVPIILYQQKGF